MSAMDIDAEREKIRQEIEELERSLGPSVPCIQVQASDSSLESGSDDEDDLGEDDVDSDTQVDTEADPGGGKGADEECGGEVDVNLPQTPETCLQMNLVYQEVIQEKIVEINLLLAQNKEQQEKLTWELAPATRRTKSDSGKSLPANMFLGHFMKPYFKDKTSGIGPPANSDAREKAMQGIKSFEELVTIKWKSREKLLLCQSVVSDHLQHLLQPKLLKLDYLNEKREKSKDEVARQILEKQIQETEREISDINLLPEEALLGNRLDEHDWDKIANINFEGTRSAKELRKYWQNSEHPSISKKEWSEEEVEKLKEIAAGHNCLDWEAVAQELGTQRTAFQCLQKFQAYSKDFKRSEWAPEEDEMLLQLVQEMRIGKHIPYRKIAYYMEGRDSAQLIYRWTKRVDPHLKRGAWTPEEDALLLKAVSKYGERDWYKIRTEVPGRSDNQCRDRYLHALHYDIKKGKWSEEEERKLVELTEKYGVGHWAKIASELPHRSGTQCLSKWKVLLGYRRNRRKKPENKLLRKRRRVQRARPRFSESSSEDSDLDLEEGDSAEEEAPKAKAEGCWRVPSIDLWVPVRRNPLQMKPEELASVTLLSKGFDMNRKRKQIPGALLDQLEHPTAEGLGDLDSGMLQPSQSQVQEGSAEEGDRNSRCPKDSWRVSLAYVKCVLRRNSYALQRRSREITRKKRFTSTSQTGPGRSLVPAAGESYRSHGQKDGMWKTTLYRRLMMAVAPWAGSTVQTWALQVKMQASRKSKVEFISKQLQTARLSSTPLFTLLIQLLHIDVDGCMKVIQKRKSRQMELLKAVVGNTGKASSEKDAEAQPSLPVASSQPSKKLIPLKAKEGPIPSPSWTVRCSGPTPKPKTVSELLREKRLREAKAKKAEQKRLVLAPQLLLPSSVIIQPQRAPAVQGLSGPQTTTNNQVPLPPAPPPVVASMPPVPSVEINLAAPRETSGGSWEMGTVRNCKGEDPPGKWGGSRHQESVLPSQNAAPFLPLQASVRDPPSPLTSPNPASATDPSCSSPASAAQQDPGNVAPTVAVSQPGSSGIPKTILPITWVLTPQGLIPMTIVSVPNQGKLPTGSPGASPKPGQATEASPVKVPTVNAVPVTNGLNQPPPGVQVQAASSSSPQTTNGATRQAALTPPTPPSFSPLPPASSRESQGSPPTACPPAPPSHSPSLWSAHPVNPASAVLAPARRNQVVGNPPCPAPPDRVKDPAGLAVQSHPACPAPPPPREDKVSPDYSLLSREDAAAVKGWAKAGLEARTAAPGASLPYLPPFLCSLKTLSALLLNKGALERAAAPLVTPEGQRDDPSQPDLDALRTLVHQRLRDNPAYQLLKARFLAAFSFPAALAALPPFRVKTTLSGGRWWESSQGEDSCLSEDDEEDAQAEREPHGAAGNGPRRAADTREEQEEPNMDSADSDQLSVPRIRRSTRLQKRRRL